MSTRSFGDDGERRVRAAAVLRFQTTRVVVVRPRPADERVVHVLRACMRVHAPPELRTRILVGLRMLEAAPEDSEPTDEG